MSQSMPKTAPEIFAPGSTLSRWFIGAVLLIFGASSLADDGVVEINQAAVEAGGIVPGDDAGFPATLSRPGSYRLVSNLSGGNSGEALILVTGDNVTLDLNGFTAIGAESVRWGIRILGAHSRVSGGGVVGGTSACISVESAFATLTALDVSGCGFAGIQVTRDNVTIEASRVAGGTNGGIVAPVEANGCRVVGNSVSGGGGAGISMGHRGCLVKENVVMGSGNGGISAGRGALIDSNVVYSNGGAGIAAKAGSRVSNNTVSYGGDDGIFLWDGGVLVTGNQVYYNTGSGINSTLGQSGSFVLENAIGANNQANLSAEGGVYVNNRNAVERNFLYENRYFGARILGTDNSVVENYSLWNVYGFSFGNTDNFIRGNTVSGSSTGFQSPPAGSRDGGGNVQY